MISGACRDIQTVNRPFGNFQNRLMITLTINWRNGFHRETVMQDWHQQTLSDYKSKGFADRSGYGRRPALLIIDFVNGFTDPSSPLGGDYSRELAATAKLIDAFRAGQLPIAYTIIEYDPDLRDAGVFVKKVPSLGVLVRGSPMCDVDDRIKPDHADYIVSKKYASAFFGTNLDTYLKTNGVDTLVVTGCTTSGCVRASAVDSMQNGFLTIVVREAVGDRADGPHEANLFDIDAKYGDVVSLDEALNYLQSLATQNGRLAAGRS
jgi:maleamate amidohydrolase